MLTVTNDARDLLLLRISRKKAADDLSLRITTEQKRWRVRLDYERPNDEIITYKGRNVLLLDAETARTTASLTLDVSGDGVDRRLRLFRPARREP